MEPHTRAQELEEASRAKVARVRFLPPYSPDLNPIEMAFAKLKAHQHAGAVRTIDALCRHRRYLRALRPAECESYFSTAGYTLT
jgi:transposase